jgi:hypothetical protein
MWRRRGEGLHWPVRVWVLPHVGVRMWRRVIIRLWRILEELRGGVLSVGCVDRGVWGVGCVGRYVWRGVDRSTGCFSLLRRRGLVLLLVLGRVRLTIGILLLRIAEILLLALLLLVLLLLLLLLMVVLRVVSEVHCRYARAWAAARAHARGLVLAGQFRTLRLRVRARARRDGAPPRPTECRWLMSSRTRGPLAELRVWVHLPTLLRLFRRLTPVLIRECNGPTTAVRIHIPRRLRAPRLRVPFMIVC